MNSKKKRQVALYRELIHQLIERTKTVVLLETEQINPPYRVSSLSLQEKIVRFMEQEEPAMSCRFGRRVLFPQKNYQRVATIVMGYLSDKNYIKTCPNNEERKNY